MGGGFELQRSELFLGSPVPDRSIYAQATSPKIKRSLKSNIFSNYITISLFNSLNSLFTGSFKLYISFWQVLNTVLYLLYGDFVLFLVTTLTKVKGTTSIP
jgi:hypothetical protein